MKGISSFKKTQWMYQEVRYIPVENILFESEKLEIKEVKALNSTSDPIMPTTTVGYSKSSFTRNLHLLHVVTNQFPSLRTSWWHIYIYIYTIFDKGLIYL